MLLGWDNTAKSLTTGHNNTGLGFYTYGSLTSGSDNTAVGMASGENIVDGNLNSTFGYTAGAQNLSEDSIFGAYADGALQSSGDSNSRNNAFGAYSQYFLGTGTENSSFGREALHSNYAGGYNSTLGNDSLYSTTGSYNTALGYEAGQNITSGSNNIAIGINSYVPFATGNYQLNIGNLIYGTGLNGSGNTLSTGNIGIGIATPGLINIPGLSASSVVYTDSSNNLTTTSPTTGIAAFWQRNAGALAPAYITDDVLLGSTSTGSATIDLQGTSGTGRFSNLITQNLILSASSSSILSAYSGFDGFTNFSGGIGTGGKDSINIAERLTSTGNLTNIGSLQAGEVLLTSAGIFAPHVDYVTGTQPWTVAIGDLNGDGKADLVTPNYNIGNGNTISVFLNNGNGTFATKTNYSTGTNSGPMSVAIGDLNGDGKADLAVSDFGNNKISVLMNLGNGTFASHVDYTPGSEPDRVAIGDLNGDGKPDLAVANYSGSTVSVFINNGNGTFASKVDYTTGSWANGVAIGDLNGDGKADLAVADENDSKVSVFLNNGNGTFAAKADYNTGSNPRYPAIGDLNGDGKPDLVVK
jgi:hypothetical protein